MTNKDDARGRRLKKLRIAENRANAEEIKEHRKEEAIGKEIDMALAELFNKWQAEARNEDEATEEAEKDEEGSKQPKRIKTSNEGKENEHSRDEKGARRRANKGTRHRSPES